ncbi:hemin uptake protein HemP [Sphaerotilus sp.]|uniref:hemin uptake protein HemP n=1 Tax=Sphaerotilus sp. TaxID=2093942 RepID=UPI002ACE61AB|nr:hemin uptake protein HemP [Sphaerotilus sp.]MDZ7855805.1 hemin uptake protein HemP [Sphaerotilus sp.]
MPDVLPLRQPTAPRSSHALTPTPAAGSPAPSPASDTPRLSSAQLFGQGSEVHIEHGDALYRLRITSLGKLILTK